MNLFKWFFKYIVPIQLVGYLLIAIVFNGLLGMSIDLQYYMVISSIYLCWSTIMMKLEEKK